MTVKVNNAQVINTYSDLKQFLSNTKIRVPTKEYRLLRKKSGELVLQRAFNVGSMDETTVEWEDQQTIDEE